MREIKFRFWDANTKVMDYDRRYFPWADEEISVDAFFDTSEETPGSTWLQWTGLKNEKGIEIYEGDILDLGHKLKPCTVVWQGVEFIGVQSKCQTVSLVGFHKTAEVIGNIYENPDLLNQ